MKTIWILAVTVDIALGASAAKAETIRYTYDARGRLVVVVREGGPAPQTVRYDYDRADNRKVKTTS